jgi:hypothetical protein
VPAHLSLGVGWLSSIHESADLITGSYCAATLRSMSYDPQCLAQPHSRCMLRTTPHPNHNRRGACASQGIDQRSYHPAYAHHNPIAARLVRPRVIDSCRAIRPVHLVWAMSMAGRAATSYGSLSPIGGVPPRWPSLRYSRSACAHIHREPCGR